MRAVCSTDVFGKKLALVSRGVSARSTIQLLGGILLEAEEGALQLSATDMEISIQTVSPAEVEGEGRAVIPARIFNDIVRPLPAGNFTLEYDGSEGTVRLAAGANEDPIRTSAAAGSSELPGLEAAGRCGRGTSRWGATGPRGRSGLPPGRTSTLSGPTRRTTIRSCPSSRRRD